MFTDTQRRKAWSPAARRKAKATRLRNLAAKRKATVLIPLDAVPSAAPARSTAARQPRSSSLRSLAQLVVAVWREMS